MLARVPNTTQPWTGLGPRGAEPRAPTSEDVARVSRALLSLVARQSPTVSKYSRVRVLAAGEAPAYRLNLHARNLGANSMDIIAADPHNPFFAGVVNGLHTEAAAHGKQVIITSGGRQPKPHVDRLALRTLLERTQGRTEPVCHVVAPSLVVRTTSAPVRAGDLVPSPSPIPQESSA